MNENELCSQKTDSFNMSAAKWDCLFSVLELFPIPLEVFSPDGLSMFVNKEFLNFFRIYEAKQIVGKFNILNDTYINRDLELSDYLQRVFSGEILYFYDLRVPSEEMDRRYKGRKSSLSENDMYQDITCFPLWNEDKSISCVVALFMTKHVYQSRLDVMKAKEYINKHWHDDFDSDNIASEVGLSSDHLIRLFRKFIGMTPYSYYQEIKIEKIKEALQNKNLSIREAFASCGTDYSGNFAEIFKRRHGMTPTQYRKNLADVSEQNSQYNTEFHKQALYSDWQGLISESNNLLFQIAELFPIPIQIFKRNGDIVFINEAVLKAWNVLDSSLILGKYNLIKDSLVNEQFGLSEHIRRIFRGEIVLIQDIRVPLEKFWEWYNIRSTVYDTEMIYTDILNFPVWGEDKRIAYIVSIFLTSRLYQGRTDITKAKEYLENHWREEFDTANLAQAVCLSPSQLARLFKKHTGTTLYNYYQDIKINRLKEALRDRNLSIAEAFISCGFTYSSNCARFFKEKVGMTPSQYRKIIGK